MLKIWINANIRCPLKSEPGVSIKSLVRKQACVAFFVKAQTEDAKQNTSFDSDVMQDTQTPKLPQIRSFILSDKNRHDQYRLHPFCRPNNKCLHGIQTSGLQ